MSIHFKSSNLIRVKQSICHKILWDFHKRRSFKNQDFPRYNETTSHHNEKKRPLTRGISATFTSPTSSSTNLSKSFQSCLFAHSTFIRHPLNWKQKAFESYHCRIDQADLMNVENVMPKMTGYKTHSEVTSIEPLRQVEIIDRWPLEVHWPKRENTCISTKYKFHVRSKIYKVNNTFWKDMIDHVIKTVIQYNSTSNVFVQTWKENTLTYNSRTITTKQNSKSQWSTTSKNPKPSNTNSQSQKKETWYISKAKAYTNNHTPIPSIDATPLTFCSIHIHRRRLSLVFLLVEHLPRHETKVTRSSLSFRWESFWKLKMHFVVFRYLRNKSPFPFHENQFQNHTHFFHFSWRFATFFFRNFFVYHFGNR